MGQEYVCIACGLPVFVDHIYGKQSPCKCERGPGGLPKAPLTGEATAAVGGKVVKFGTGATRSAETAFDPEGFISPAVIAEFSRYMAEHRVQADGALRASDNWQKGMPTSRAWRSLSRHYLDAWLIHRGYPAVSPDCTTLRGALCGILFNTMLLMKNIIIDKDDHEPVSPNIECAGGHDGMGCGPECRR